MIFKIGLENGDENRSIAWVLGHPGCFAYGPDPGTALAEAPQAIRDYHDWICKHQGECWFDIDEIQIEHAETWEVYAVSVDYERVEDGYSVNAWFQHDWKPLTAEEIERGLKLLDWSRADLLETAKDLDQGALNRPYPGERWNIEGILKHIAGAEWWYLDRLEMAFPRRVLHDSIFERLEKVRAHLNDLLPGLAGSTLVRGIEAEFWSPRKLLRRAVWHERDHTRHIRKLLKSGG
jgi:hypothetical protein